MPARDDEVQALVEQLSAESNRSVLVDDAGLRLLGRHPAALRRLARHDV